jgi:uncharacterized membrane protein (UPF0127 family)
VIRSPRAHLAVTLAITLAVVAVVVGACGASTPPPASPSSTVGLADLPVVVVQVDGDTLRLAVALDKARGLSGIDDLGALDGMLFEYPAEVSPQAHPFWMRGVRFPLDIAFFDASGHQVDHVRLEPCPPSGPCPRHTAAAPFRWVVETLPGRIAASSSLRLIVPPTDDPCESRYPLLPFPPQHPLDEVEGHRPDDGPNLGAMVRG